MEGHEGWDEYAPFYDWENARTLGKRDVPFWRNLALQAGGPVLELGCGTGRVALPLDFPVEGAEVLIVEDILDTGRTLHDLREHLVRRRPRRVRIAVLLDKPSGREVAIHPEYVGFTVGNHWVVGYGLDADGLYRNLPYVTYVE